MISNLMDSFEELGIRALECEPNKIICNDDSPTINEII